MIPYINNKVKEKMPYKQRTKYLPKRILSFPQHTKALMHRVETVGHPMSENSLGKGLI